MSIKHYEVILTDSAKLDLEEIYEYIKDNLKESDVANQLMSKIESDILRLEQYPFSCMEVKVKPHKKLYRKLVTGKYIVLYRVEEEDKQVVILNVIYGKKDYLNDVIS